MAKRSKVSSGCRCKIGRDHKKHCFRFVGRKIRGCKKR